MNAAARDLPARRLSDLLAGLADGPIADAAVLGVESDSRRVRPGDLFLAARGGSRHGLSFLEQALAGGAAALAWEPRPGLAAPVAPVPAAPVPGLAAHVSEIAARYFGRPSADLFCVGVTGTDGKTSCAHILAQALVASGTPCGYLGTLGYGVPDDLRLPTHTTPAPVDLQRWIAALGLAGARALVMEVSSHALDQHRAAAVAFDVAILTNLGRDHLDYHATPEAYAAAKRRLFDVPGLRVGVINGDDPVGRRWIHELTGHGRIVAYGFDSSAGAGADLFVQGVDLAPHGDGLALTVSVDGQHTHLSSGLLGRFNAYNLLAAFATLLARDLTPDQAAAALAAVRTVPGRMEGFRAAGRPLVVVDYAHTPEALAGALAALRPHTHGRLWCVFGCGGDRDRGKRPLMARAAAEGADWLMLTDDNPRGEDPAVIVADMLSGLPPGRDHTVDHDRGRAIRAVIEQAAADDVVLVAGKGHEREQIVAGERRPFSDRETVAGYLGVSA